MNQQPKIQLEASVERQATAWPAVLLIYLAGCTTAIHIGKIPVAIPLLQDVWRLSLTQSGLIISLYSILIASCGLLLGLVIRRCGYVLFGIIGVATVGVGSLLGSFAESLPLLLVGRAIEGLGWIISVIALPSLMSALSVPADRPLVMAIWASFLPIGAGFMLLNAPVLQFHGGWQLSWLVGSAVSFIAAAVVFFIARQYKRELSHLAGVTGQRNYSDLTKRVVWLLSGCFLLYSFSYIPLVSFLPLLLVESSNLTLGEASSIAALVLICNSLGSVSTGVFLRKGYRYETLLIVGALCSGICAIFIFAPDSGTTVRILCAFVFSISSGVIPGALFATMPKLASSPSSVGLLVGLMMQLSGVGMLLGGVLIPGAIEYFNSWAAAGWVVFCSAVCCALLAYLTIKRT